MSPCPISLPSDPSATAATSKSSSRSAFPSAGSKNDSGAPHASFHKVLSKVDSKSSNDDEDQSSADDSTTNDDSITAGDRRAMMLAMTMQSGSSPSTIATDGNSASTDATIDPTSADSSSPFTLTDSHGQSISQLLADGKNQLNFQLNGAIPGTCSQSIVPQKSSVTNASTAAPDPSSLQNSDTTIASPNPGDTPKISQLPANVASAATPGTVPVDSKIAASIAADSAAAAIKGQIAGKAASAKASANAIKAAAKGSEKFAATLDNSQAVGGNSSNEPDKNQVLAADLKQLKEGVADVGTAVANGVKSMVHSASISADFASSSTAGQSSASSTTTQTSTSLASHAADMVHQIGEIADEMSAVGRSSVEVKFNFSEQDQLSVRVQYRNGEVQATFRTDSQTVRDAITREWQTQNFASDSRPYRVADPVFTASGHDAGTSAGDFSRQQQQQQQRSTEQTSSFDRSFFNSSRSAASTTSAPAVAAAPTRPETAGLLHALV